MQLCVFFFYPFNNIIDNNTEEILISQLIVGIFFCLELLYSLAITMQPHIIMIIIIQKYNSAMKYHPPKNVFHDAFFCDG